MGCLGICSFDFWVWGCASWFTVLLVTGLRVLTCVVFGDYACVVYFAWVVLHGDCCVVSLVFWWVVGSF